jgi:hypothetical protein
MKPTVIISYVRLQYYHRLLDSPASDSHAEEHSYCTKGEMGSLLCFRYWRLRHRALLRQTPVHIHLHTGNRSIPRGYPGKQASNHHNHLPRIALFQSLTCASQVNLWSIIEVNSAIVCANIPALKPLFKPRSLLESFRGCKRSSGYEYHSSERSGATGKSTGSGLSSDHSRNESNASGAGFAQPPAGSYDRHTVQTQDSEETIGLEPLPEAYLKV